nr:MAG TPA: hypothetical protein [Caudoviricetes sp.]
MYPVGSIGGYPRVKECSYILDGERDRGNCPAVRDVPGR